VQTLLELPLVKKSVERLENNDLKPFELFKQDELDPEIALNRWLEKKKNPSKKQDKDSKKKRSNEIEATVAFTKWKEETGYESDSDDFGANDRLTTNNPGTGIIVEDDDEDDDFGCNDRLDDTVKPTQKPTIKMGNGLLGADEATVNKSKKGGLANLMNNYDNDSDDDNATYNFSEFESKK